MASSKSEYKVGYGKPPIATRFRKGQSGNAKGRPRGTRNFKSDLRAELAAPVSVRADGRSETVSSQRAAVKQLRAKALKGDPRALDRLLALAERYDLEDAADEGEQQLTVEDTMIVERFRARVIEEHEADAASRQADEEAETPK